jgi:hypothetical protein
MIQDSIYLGFQEAQAPIDLGFLLSTGLIGRGGWRWGVLWLPVHRMDHRPLRTTVIVRRIAWIRVTHKVLIMLAGFNCRVIT